MSQAGARVGILGGTFDPIHRGHLDVARAAHDALALDEVWLIPSRPPHRPAQPLASDFHRFAMVALAADEAPWLVACDMELSEQGPSYTSRTLRRVAEDGFDPSRIFFLIGADAFAEIDTWRDYPALLDLARFVVVSRPGWPVSALRLAVPSLADRMIDLAAGATVPAQPAILLVDAVTADVSSTEVRRRLASGTPLEDRVPAAVERHALRHGLYRA